MKCTIRIRSDNKPIAYLRINVLFKHTSLFKGGHDRINVCLMTKRIATL